MAPDRLHRRAKRPGNPPVCNDSSRSTLSNHWFVVYLLRHQFCSPLSTQRLLFRSSRSGCLSRLRQLRANCIINIKNPLPRTTRGIFDTFIIRIFLFFKCRNVDCAASGILSMPSRRFLHSPSFAIVHELQDIWTITDIGLNLTT